MTGSRLRFTVTGRRTTDEGRNLTVSETRTPNRIESLDEAKLGKTHLRTVVVAGLGFFADAYDLFVIGIVSTLLKHEWHLGTGQLALLNAVMLGAAFLGAIVLGRIADKLGRARIFGVIAAAMVVASIGSALAPSLAVLVGFRFLLGFGVGGNYPVSAVLMTENANRADRGKLVSLVFSTQALGLIVGPLAALALLGSGAGDDLTWRLLLGLGAVPAAFVVWLQRRLPESTRFAAAQAAASVPAQASASASAPASVTSKVGVKTLFTSRKFLTLLAGTAGCWFLLDYAYYGNTISTPQIVGLISPNASDSATIAIELAIFVIAAVPGYALAILKMDRIGHRRLQLAGFVMMGVCFAVIGLVPGMTTMVIPFLIAYGISYFFSEFGPNVTTFVLPGEVFPASVRATGHGIAAGTGKLGAFIGVFLFPLLQNSLGLRGTLLLTGGVSVLGALLTLVLPEPAGRSLEEVSGDTGVAMIAADPDQAVPQAA